MRGERSVGEASVFDRDASDAESAREMKMRDWAEDLLSSQSLGRHDFLDHEGVRSLWTMHLEGRRRWHFEIWKILMFQNWHRTYVS